MNNKAKKIRVLDFGCSEKPYKYFFDKYKNIEMYIGLDVYDGKLVDVVYDGNIIPFEDEYFDFIFSSSVLEHVEHVDNTINEINRVLKKRGGVTVHSIPFVNHIHGTPYDFHRPTYYGWLNKFRDFKNVDILNSDSRYCCLINMITSQINFVVIKSIKLILNKNRQPVKDITKGDASPENSKSKKLAYMYFILKLNPINFILGLSCYVSNIFPSNKDKEGEITSAYLVKAQK